MIPIRLIDYIESEKDRKNEVLGGREESGLVAFGESIASRVRRPKETFSK